jgi:hypothetical protein
MPGEDFHLSVVAPLQAHSGGAATPRMRAKRTGETRATAVQGSRFVQSISRPLTGRCAAGAGRGGVCSIQLIGVFCEQAAKTTLFS